MNKYKNKKVVVDDIEFDSIKEKNRYVQLKLLEKAKLIEQLELQKTFQLQEGYTINGKSRRKITYIADFYYYDNHLKKYIVEDVKGIKTEVYKIKKKLFEYKYGIEISEV